MKCWRSMKGSWRIRMLFNRCIIDVTLENTNETSMLTIRHTDKGFRKKSWKATTLFFHDAENLRIFQLHFCWCISALLVLKPKTRDVNCSCCLYEGNDALSNDGVTGVLFIISAKKRINLIWFNPGGFVYYVCVQYTSKSPTKMLTMQESTKCSGEGNSKSGWKSIYSFGWGALRFNQNKKENRRWYYWKGFWERKMLIETSI